MVALLLPAIQPALALEVNYPTLNGISLDSDSTLVQSIKYFFTFALAIAGILAILIIVISGAQILLSGGSPQAMGDAKERILGAVLGIVLLMASFIIMRTINPQLVSQTNDGLPNQNAAGVYLQTTYTTGTIIATGAPAVLGAPYVTPEISAPQSDPRIEIPDLERNMPPNGPTLLQGSSATRTIRYNCTPPDGITNGPKLLIWVYDAESFQIDKDASGFAMGTTDTISLPCNSNAGNKITFGAATKSYKWAIESPGAYFYLKPDCTGIASDLYTQNARIAPFDCQPGTNRCAPNATPSAGNQNPRCVKIVNSKDRQYGVILNQEPTAMGECSYPLINKDLPPATDSNLATPFIIPDAVAGTSVPRYAYVFQQVPAPATGQIKFQSENLYVELRQVDFPVANNRRWFRIPMQYQNLDEWLKLPYAGDPAASPPVPPDNPQGLGRRLNPAIDPAADECRDNDVPCLKKIRRTGGSFRVILYGSNEVDYSDDACQVYTCQENNFDPSAANPNRWIFSDNRKPYDMYVIPMPGVACSTQ